MKIKIKTDKIRKIGSGILFTNIIAGAFAAPTVNTIQTSENFYNLDSIVMSGGTDSAPGTLPTIQLSGGQSQETYTLAPTDFTGGNSEIISEIQQIIMGSGVQGVQYQESNLDQTLKLSGGVKDEYSNLKLQVVDIGQEEQYVEFNEGNDIQLSGGQEATYAVGISDELITPTPGYVAVHITLGENSKVGLGALTETEILTYINNYGLPFIVELKEGKFFAKYTNSGEIDNLNNFPIEIRYQYSNEGITYEYDNLLIEFTNGQNFIPASAEVEITEAFPDGGEDDKIKIGEAKFIEFSNDPSHPGKDKLEIAEKIENELNSAYSNLEFTIIEDANPKIKIASNSHEDYSIPVDNSHAQYSIVTATSQKYTIEILDNLIENAQDNYLKIDDEEFHLENFELSISEILNEFLSREYELFEKSLTDNKLLLTARTKGEFEDDYNPIGDGKFSTINGVKATAEFTFTENLPAGATDDEITILGETINLGNLALDTQEIAQKIKDEFTHSDYEITNDGAKIIITSQNYGVDETIIFGDNHYTTVNEVLSESNVVDITTGIVENAIADRQITINGKTITFGTNEEFTPEELAQEIVTQYNANPEDNEKYEARRDGNLISFIQREGFGMPDTTELISDRFYNSEDNAKATATLTIPISKTMPTMSQDKILNILGTEINLGDETQTNTQILEQIAGKTYTGYTVQINEDKTEVTFTTENFGDDQNKLFEASDLEYVTQNEKQASSTFEIINEYAGISADNLITTDNQIQIGTVLIDLGVSTLTQEQLAQAITQTLSQDSTFQTTYTVNKIENEPKVKITKKEVGSDETILSGHDDIYTKINEIRSTGTLTITEEIVENAIDKDIQIAGKLITFLNKDYSTNEMASFIVSELLENPNVIATLDETNPSKINFKSKLIGTNGNSENLATEKKYNGRSEITTIDLGNFVQGYTYQIGVKDNLYTDLVTPQDTTNFAEQIATLIDNDFTDNQLSVQQFGNIITLEGPVEEDFVVTATGHQDHAPTATNVEIVGTIQEGKQLTCEYTYQDQESDEQAATEFKWYRNNIEISDATESTYTLTNADGDSQIKCEVTPKAQTGVKTGQLVQSPEIITPVVTLTLNNGETFSTPVCLDSTKSLEKANFNIETQSFSSYTTGQWETFEGKFDLLKGYKYTGDEEIKLPLYTSGDCDFTDVKIKVQNDFNLVGLNSKTSKKAGDFLASLTLRAHLSQYVNAVYDEVGMNLGNYDSISAVGQFKTNEGEILNIEPTKAYWITYNGDDDKTFFGFEGEILY